MNKFNDIISDKEFFDLPESITHDSDYKNIIRKAFMLTDGLLSLNNFSMINGEKHINFKILSKDTETKFRINPPENNQVDVNNLVRGLNKALTDIFYLFRQ